MSTTHTTNSTIPSNSTLETRAIQEVRKICCIGAGYVGGPTSAVIASQAPNIQCTVVDLNQARIDAWKSADLPIYEPKLAEIVQSTRDGKARPPNLFFTTDIDRAIDEADLIFISVNTPTKMTGTGAGKASDLGYVESAVRRIAEVSQSNKIVVEKSTVPCRTADTIRDTLAVNCRSGIRFDVLSNPEFLAEGTAINNLLYPDRILIGSMPGELGDRAAALLADVYAHWVPRHRIITINLWSSELAKLAANAMLAQRISSINTLSAICEMTGADIGEVSYAVGLDERIGPHMLKSSVGFGGSCFRKDILNLVYLAESLHLPEVASYWKSVVDINEWQKSRFTKRIISCLNNTLSNKKVTILGFAYKKNTGDTRETAAISVIHSLIAESAQIAVYDPQVKENQIWQDLRNSCYNKALVENLVRVYDNAYAACEASNAIIILTEWDAFRCEESGMLNDKVELLHKARQSGARDVAARDSENFEADNVHTERGGRGISSKSFANGHPQKETRLNWRRIAKTMRKPRFVFDGRNIVDRSYLRSLGFRVECIGAANHSINDYTKVGGISSS